MEAQALMDQAIQAFDAGDTASCLEHASRAVLLDPGNATLWFRKGLMSLPLDRYDEVIECYERALTINPRYVAAWFNKGLTHAILQQRMQALQCFERAIKLAPREVKAMYQKGKVLVELNKLQEAIKCFDCVISIDSKHAGAWHSRGAAFAALGDEEEALRCYIHCTRLNLGDADAWYNKGVSEQALGLISDALVSYDEAIRHNPEHGLAWGNKGSLLLEGGRVREALLCFERAVRLGNARAANGIATCRKVLRKTRDGEPAKLHGQFAPGDIIENAFSVYEVHHGAMGVVYLSYDNRLKCPAAIKTIQERHASNPGLRRRFLEEGRIWARLGKHPNIVHCYGAMEGFDGRPYILLEHIEGDRAVGLSLRDWLKKGRLNLFNLLVFGIDICRGMSHAASSVPGFVHSDLKPENVLVTHDHTAKVTDFGLAKAFVEETNNRLGGTFAYASPEQIKGSTVDQRSDVYAFGCILHEMLTGRHPYRGMSMKAITRSHLEETPVPILPLGPEIPRRLQTLMRSCLEKKRERRPTGFLAICRELEQILEEHPPATRGIIAFFERGCGGHDHLLVTPIRSFLGKRGLYFNPDLFHVSSSSASIWASQVLRGFPRD